MMITIHGLPISAKYHDVKVLIKQQCNITDFILDSLVSENDTKKVRVGLADDSEGSHLTKCLNGFRLQGNILRVVPVGKASSITQQSNTFEARGSYQQTDYSNQNINERNRTLDAAKPTNWAHNQWASNQLQPVPVQSNYGYQQPVATPYGQPTNTVFKPHFEPRDMIQSSRGPQQSHNYNYNPKSNLISLGPQNNAQMPSTLHEIPQASSRPSSGRYPNQSYDMPSEKPITIMKENFQGPNQYNLASSHNQVYQSQGQISPWANQQPQQKSFEKPLPTFDKKPYDDRKYPSQTKHIQDPSKLDDSYKYDKIGRGYSPQRKDFRDVEERARTFKGNQYTDRRTPERRMSPSNRNVPSGRHFSPGRQISPSGGHVLTAGRHSSPPSRHVSQSGRRPSPPGRHTIPVPSGGRYVSPSGRHASPAGRRASPSRQMSSNREMLTERKMSPSRRDSPQFRKEEYVRGRRMSPRSHSPIDRRPLHQSSDRDARDIPSHVRHGSPRRQPRFTSPHRIDQKQAPYQDDHHAGMKNVRPAYEPHVQAPNEAMYSGGYRPNIRDEAIKYQSRSEHWKERENFSSKGLIEDRRDSPRIQQFEVSRASERPTSTEQDVNRSRSPKRDRSPIRDRFKRHSPSPRSPRRSWALEKRRSTEIREPPPPPVWPQEKEEYSLQVRPKFFEKEMEKNSPVWETREKIRDIFLSSVDRRNFPDQRALEVGKWKATPGSNPQPSSSSRFEEPTLTRKEFENRRELIRDDQNRKLQIYSDRLDKEYRQERSDMRCTSNFNTKDEMSHKRDEFSGHIEEKKKEILFKQEQLQKEIDEVYKRAVDFTKKAELYRKGESKREGNYNDDHRHTEARVNPTEMQRFKKHPYEDEQDPESFRRDYKYSRVDDKKNVDEDIEITRHNLDDTQKSRDIGRVKKIQRELVEDISQSIMKKQGKFLSGEIKRHAIDELKLTLSYKVNELFKNKDLSFIEMYSKFNTKYTFKDQENIFKDVMFSLPKHYSNMKREAQDDCDAPAKSSRRSSEPSANKERPADRREAMKKLAASEEQKHRVAETTSTENKRNKNVEDKEIVKTQEKKTPTKGVEGQFQLNDLMTRILEDELKTIMIEVWQALPDDPPTEAEKFVAEKLRYEASDDLRNVLGLNVTKRLLNIYNPLIVKLQFSCRPKSGGFLQFLKTYNVKTYRRFNKDVNIFVARLTSITDFDKLCTNKKLRCGNAKVIVTPIYKFSKCPKKLITIFNYNDEEESKMENKEYKDGEVKDGDKSDTIDSKNEKTNIKTKDLENKRKDKKIEEKLKIKPVKNEDNKALYQDTATKVGPPITIHKEKEPDNKATKKIVLDNKPKGENVKKSAPKIKNNAVNPKKETDNINKNISKNEKLKVTPIKKVTKEKAFLNGEVMEDEIQEFNADDEMNDEEILALISEGVVVDECIGSDGE